MIEKVRNSLIKLHTYCETQDWSGYDPFDGLNSKIFQFFPFFKSHRLFRLIFLQLNKRSIINFRPLLGVGKGVNPKGVGLFLTASLKLYKKTKEEKYLILAKQFIEG